MTDKYAIKLNLHIKIILYKIENLEEIPSFS